MSLITTEILKNLPPLYSLENSDPQDVKIAVKFFTPDSDWSWFATEGEEVGGDVRFFGMVHGHSKELGYFMLSDLEAVGIRSNETGYFRPSDIEVALGTLTLPIERDQHFTGTLADVL